MAINYEDERFDQVEKDKKAAVNEVDKTYGDMISQSDKYYQDQIDAAQEYADKQTALQNQQTEQTITEINQQKDQAKKDYTREQSGAYVDWQQQSNQYGANAEAMAMNGMTKTGFAESSQVSMYNTYQSRVSAARESYMLAVQNYDNAIAQARLQNSSILAEIAYNALQAQLELSLQGFQYKNQLLLAQADRKTEIENMYYQRYQDVVNQINTENAFAEQIRQFNAQMAEEKRQFDILHPAWGSSIGNSAKGKIIKSANQVTNNSNDGGKVEEKAEGIANRHGNSWIEIPGHGRFSYQEVLSHVEKGDIIETIEDGKYKYTWAK